MNSSTNFLQLQDNEGIFSISDTPAWKQWKNNQQHNKKCLDKYNQEKNNPYQNSSEYQKIQDKILKKRKKHDNKVQKSLNKLIK